MRPPTELTAQVAPTAPDTEGSTAPGTVTRLGRVRGPVLLAGVVLVLGLALHLRDPHQQGTWGFCPLNVATGGYCPGCGGLRAVNDLTGGDVAAAASSNLLVVAAMPVAAVAWLRAVGQRWRGVRRPLPAALVGPLAGLALVAIALFTVLRNLPAGAWLAP